MEKNKLTQKKFDELTAELQWRKTEKRDSISNAIKIARGFGDLSENSEYHAAKHEQESNEIEIARLEDILADVEIIDEKNIDTTQVGLGRTVKIHDFEFDEDVVYSIVSSLECNVFENKISDKSPIGKAIVGHKKGEIVVAKTPSGEMKYKILDIKKTVE